MIIDTRNDVEKFMIAGDQIEKGFGSQSDLYLKLVTEEVIFETFKAFDKDDIVEIADGIADSIWVIEGLCITLDQNLNYVWMDVKNILKYSEKEEITKESMIEAVVNGYVTLRSDYRVQMNAFVSGSAALLIADLLRLGDIYNIPMQEVWDEVSRSNMSKISENGKVLKNEFGKIQKPSTFSPANIRAILEKHDLV